MNRVVAVVICLAIIVGWYFFTLREEGEKNPQILLKETVKLLEEAEKIKMKALQIQTDCLLQLLSISQLTNISQETQEIINVFIKEVEEKEYDSKQLGISSEEFEQLMQQLKSL